MCGRRTPEHTPTLSPHLTETHTHTHIRHKTHTVCTSRTLRDFRPVDTECVSRHLFFSQLQPNSIILHTHTHTHTTQMRHTHTHTNTTQTTHTHTHTHTQIHAQTHRYTHRHTNNGQTHRGCIKCIKNDILFTRRMQLI